MHCNTHIFKTLFVDLKEIESHSICKAAATYCYASVHLGPPIVSVCLRAGWTIGRVKERHLKYENAGDELVGRTLTGIPPTSCEFGISPVYFSCSQTDEPLVQEFACLVISYSIFKIDKPEVIGR